MKSGAIISYLASLFCVIIGLNKMFVYENSDIFPEDNVNAYVGGDAYNMIINANYATAYFTLAILCAVIGTAFTVVHVLNNYKDANTNVIPNTIENADIVG